MHEFRVWAPLVSRISVWVNGTLHVMNGPDEHGAWRVQVEEAGPGTNYGFTIDDDPGVIPDPRSLCQPNGVHGLSRIYDQGAFAWTDAGFRPGPLSSAIVYELHVGTFTAEGTLDAAIANLDYLAELGVSHIELMPVAAFPGNHGWGYDGVALFAVYARYGGPDALKRFVNAAHARGIAVLLDVVYNHFGPDGNYTGKFGLYTVDTHHTPWGGAVNLEGKQSHEVRRFFCDNAIMWMRDYHLDGLRLDAVHAYIDRSAFHFLEQLAVETKSLEALLGRHKVLIAESDSNDPRIVTPREAGGFGIDAQWSDDFHHALFSALYPGPTEGYYSDFGKLCHLAKSIENTFVYDGIFSNHRGRVHGDTPLGLSQHRFLGYIQNHDQVGNRAFGERLHENVGFERAAIAAAFVLFAPFVPMIFQGEEWAASSPFQYFADHEDPELARLVSAGRKHEFESFGWNPESIPDPEKRETHQRSILDWTEVNEGSHSEMLLWYRGLIRLRRSEQSLNIGEPGNARVNYDESAQWISVRRGSISLYCNLGKQVRQFCVHRSSVLLASSRPELSIQQGTIAVTPDSVVIVKTPEETIDGADCG